MDYMAKHDPSGFFDVDFGKKKIESEAGKKIITNSSNTNL